MKKVVILTEGGGNKGMGHISRCLSLSQAFELRGYFIQFIVNSPDSSISLLEESDYKILDWISNDKIVLNEIINVEIVIIDSYSCPINFYNIIAKKCRKIINIDDNLRMEYEVGFIVNGVIGAEHIEYKKKPGVHYLLGSKYAFLRSTFWNVPVRKLNENVKSVLVTCGGNDINSLSLNIVKFLSKNFPNLKILTILNDINNPDLVQLNILSKVYYNLSADEIKQIMLEVDIAITAAGQTTYELCRLGTPYVAMITADNQIFSISNFYKAGVVQMAIKPSDPFFFDKLHNQLINLNDFSYRKTISKKMQYLIDGNGSLNIVSSVIN
jgi:UDP-2,4-diacetamido-2,4,6-trideoxy-beta-L-altropyranose hydrolase